MSLYNQQTGQRSERENKLSKQWFKKFAISHPAFQFVVGYSEIMRDCDAKSPEYGRWK
jgi:hypothetical protein